LRSADTLTSSATRRPPRFFGITFEGSSSSDITSKSTSDLTCTSSAYSESSVSRLLSGVDRELAQMFRDLQYLSMQVVAKDQGTLIIDPFNFMDSVCMAETYIDSLIHERIERINTSEHCIQFAAAVLEKGNIVPVGACARTGAIYVYLILRKIPIYSPVFDWMVNRVRQDLERTEPILRHLYWPELLFWMLFVGGMASLGRPERSWFCFKLARYRNTLKLSSWIGAKEELEKFAWLDVPGETLGISLWQELDRIR
jgi:hypothetical protein